MELSYFIFLFSSFIFVILLLKLTIGTRAKSRSTVKLPPGPRKLPLIGHLHLLVSSDPPHRVLKDLSAKYGGVMHLQLGEINTVVISSSEIAKELFKTHDIAFAYRPSILSAEIMTNGNTNIGFTPYGEYWRQLRKICTLELLSAKRVQSFRSIREEEFLNLCRWIASKEGSGSPVNLTERVNLTMYDVVTLASLGKKTGEQAALISLMKEAIELLSGFYIGDLYPSIKLFPLISGLKRKIEIIYQKVNRILTKIVDDHIAAANDEMKKQKDLVDVLLKFHVDAGGQLALTTDNIKSVLQDMFAAGTETSSTTIDWIMAELLKNPSVMKKVQEEVRRVYDKQGYVDESLHELDYLKSVIKEGLRLHSPIPLLLPRENREQQVQIDGYEIPIKTRLLVNVWALGRDPKYWNEAESFKPERFLDNSIDFKGNDFEYLPFGGGRRICPGIGFGLANVELPLAMLLYHFDWVLPHGLKPEELAMTETLGVVAARTNPLHVIPVIKRPLPKQSITSMFWTR